MKQKETSLLLSNLRQCMKSASKYGNEIGAVIIPSSDAHQSEYLAQCDLRCRFLSGFSGSACTLVVTSSKAALWTDGRYFLQAEKELDHNWELMKVGLTETLSQEQWLKENLSAKCKIGVNPFVYSFGAWNKMKNNLEKNGHELEEIDDIVDKVWEGKPPRPSTDLLIADKKIQGKTVKEKISELRLELKSRKAKWMVVTALDDIAWLLNMRASDIEFNPVFFAYIVVGTTSVHLFIGADRITPEIQSHLNCDVTIEGYDSIISFLKNTCSGQKTILSTGSSFAIVSSIEKENRIMTSNSLVSMAKSVKNQHEIEGMVSANIKDAVALCRFFHWMEQEVPSGKVTECSASQKSSQFRSEENGFVSLSFATISSSGPSGSIIHYCPNPDDDKTVLPDQLYLCDSGAQYIDGTTDTTRTVHFSEPSHHEKECFTRVLKGHMSLASVVFPSGTKGYMLDTLARMHLWKDGLDYRHGTGHGVGCFLNVHEGPTGIYIGNSDRVVNVASDVDIKAGMIITDEPGYYEDGKFGIRIESALLCKKAETKHKFGGKQFYCFEPIALVPIQTKMIEKSMLTIDEIRWLNKYHQRCADVIGPELLRRGHKNTHQWLLSQTKQL